MKKVASAEKVQSFIWDFAVDGGAIGSLDTKIQIPGTAAFSFVQFHCLTAMIGAGNFNIGWAAATSAIIFNAGALIAGDSLGNLNGTLIPSQQKILFTIAGAPFTAGKVIFNIVYIDSSNR